MNTDHPFILASRYIESIRHAAKKRYAKDYYQWIRAGREGDEPEASRGVLPTKALEVRRSINWIMQEHADDDHLRDMILGRVQ